MLMVNILLAVPLLLRGAVGAAVQYPLNQIDSVSHLGPGLLELEAALRQIPGKTSRIENNHPVAKPCYSFDESGTIKKDPEMCEKITLQRNSDAYMTDLPGSYYFGNWGSCQRDGKTCAIPAGPENANISDASTCYQGSVPDLFIDIQDAQDLKVVFNHSATIRQPIVVKNTGHDWKGRSSGPGALALWTHNLRYPRINITMIHGFRPEGSCSSSIRPDDAVMHFGAGEQFVNLYEFAHNHSRAMVGGTCPTVGIAGWLQGGGHSPLTPHYGMGVDNVRQVRIVTPKGEDLVVNSCQNEELFKAIKGGGGSTYGVIVELWYATIPINPVQEFTLRFSGLDARLVRQFTAILINNANDWASKGWGGYINTARQERSVTLMNPQQSHDAANVDMKPLIDFAKRIGASYVSTERSSWYDYFLDTYRPPKNHQSTWSGAVASRLVPSSLFNNETNQKELIDILVDLQFSRLNLWIMAVTPAALDKTKIQSSVLHPTWRESTWLIRINDRWDGFYEAATSSTNRQIFERVHVAMNRLRKLTPISGVSISEADIWEPRHAESFWGAENYEFLKRVKQEHDPNHVLQVIQGVGATGEEDRFRCYPKQTEDL